MSDHYYKQREAELEMKSVDMSDYTNKMWFIELKKYLVDVMGMNEKQLKQEFDKRFPELLMRDLF